MCNVLGIKLFYVTVRIRHLPSQRCILEWNPSFSLSTPYASSLAILDFSSPGAIPCFASFPLGGPAERIVYHAVGGGGPHDPRRSRHHTETINQQASSDSEQSLIIPTDEEPCNVTVSRIEIYKYSLTFLALPLDLKHRYEVLSLKNVPIKSKFLTEFY